jgi:succinate dehydrogenase / fumarate reductase cytochrome b subunit
MQHRPVYLNLIQIRLPIAGFMSILHRLSGVVMVAAIPLLLGMLQRSLSGAEGFAEVASNCATPAGRLLLLLLCWSLFHHLLAGIRYLLLDIDIGLERPIFRQTAWAVVIIAPALALISVGLLP